MKYIVKKLILISLLSAGLTACSHQSPLASANKRKVADALVYSSQYAEINMKLDVIAPGGYVYRECMNHTAKMDCKRVYQWMLKDLKRQKGFEQVTLKELTDETLWDTNEEEYSAVQFDAIDRKD
jgi:predicted small lipoprotein YifL